MGRIRVATLNIRREWDRWPERAPLIVDEILRLKPDLIGLQEVGHFFSQADLLLFALNRRLLDAGQVVPYTSLICPEPEDRELAEGLAFFSRLPVQAHDWLDIGHCRWAQRVRVAVKPLGWLDVVNTHLHFVSHGTSIRVEQVGHILSWLTETEGTFQVVLGDLNDLPSSAVLSRATDGNPRLCSAFAVHHGHEPPYTCPTPLVNGMAGYQGTVDYILISGGIQVLDAQLCFDNPSPDDSQLYPSDHLGLVADLLLSA